MTVEYLKKISDICYVLSGVMCIISLILFFGFNIINVLGYLTGINEKKAIENIRIQNENPEFIKSLPLKSKPKSKNSSDKEINMEKFDGLALGTSKLSTAKLMKEAMQTTILSDPGNITTVLSETENNSVSPNSLDMGFYIEYEIYFAESSEVIK